MRKILLGDKKCVLCAVVSLWKLYFGSSSCVTPCGEPVELEETRFLVIYNRINFMKIIKNIVLV